MGIDIPIKNVCICESATDNAIPLAVPIKIDKNVPAHVGHAINNPVAAPMVLIPPVSYTHLTLPTILLV